MLLQCSQPVFPAIQFGGKRVRTRCQNEIRLKKRLSNVMNLFLDLGHSRISASHALIFVGVAKSDWGNKETCIAINARLYQVEAG